MRKYQPLTSFQESEFNRMIPGVRTRAIAVSTYYKDLCSADAEDFIQEGLLYLADYVANNNGVQNEYIPRLFNGLNFKLHKYGLSQLPMKISCVFWKDLFKEILHNVVSLDRLIEEEDSEAEKGQAAVLGVHAEMNRDERIDMKDEFMKLPKKKKEVFQLLLKGYNLVQVAEILNRSYDTVYYQYRTGIDQIKENGAMPSFLVAA